MHRMSIDIAKKTWKIQAKAEPIADDLYTRLPMESSPPNALLEIETWVREGGVIIDEDLGTFRQIVSLSRLSVAEAAVSLALLVLGILTRCTVPSEPGLTLTRAVPLVASASGTFPPLASAHRRASCWAGL